MDDRVVVFELNWDALLVEEFLEMLPVVDFLVELEAIVILVHLDIVHMVPREDLGKDPAIRQVPLWVLDFVGEVEGLEPQVEFSGKSDHLYI